MVLLVLTLMISASLAGGRSSVLQGAVHLVLFAVVFVPRRGALIA